MRPFQRGRLSPRSKSAQHLDSSRFTTFRSRRSGKTFCGCGMLFCEVLVKKEERKLRFYGSRSIQKFKITHGLTCEWSIPANHSQTLCKQQISPPTHELSPTSAAKFRDELHSSRLQSRRQPRQPPFRQPITTNRRNGSSSQQGQGHFCLRHPLLPQRPLLAQDHPRAGRRPDLQAREEGRHSLPDRCCPS
jgi:hypothetical protein